MCGFLRASKMGILVRPCGTLNGHSAPGLACVVWKVRCPCVPGACPWFLQLAALRLCPPALPLLGPGTV